MELSPLALGAGRLAAFWQGNGIRESRRVIEAALDAGINVIDTADVYARGLSERTIGSVAARRRDEMFLCTKVGQIKTPAAALAAARASGTRPGLKALRAQARSTPADTDSVARCWDSAYLVRATERCLRRLRTSHVDLLMLHSPSREDLRRHDVAATAGDLLRSGATRFVGISCDTPEVAAAALEEDFVSWLEVPFNTDVASSWMPVLSAAAAKNISVLARSPLAGGAIPGLFDVSAEGRRALNEDVASECLRFAMSAPGVVSVVMGMSSLSHVEQNARLLGAARSSRRPDTRTDR